MVKIAYADRDLQRGALPLINCHKADKGSDVQ
jgi:hypothetical protein